MLGELDERVAEPWVCEPRRAPLECEPDAFRPAPDRVLDPLPFEAVASELVAELLALLASELDSPEPLPLEPEPPPGPFSSAEPRIA